MDSQLMRELDQWIVDLEVEAEREEAAGKAAENEEVIAAPITFGSAAYLKWIDDSL